MRESGGNWSVAVSMVKKLGRETSSTHLSGVVVRAGRAPFGGRVLAERSEIRFFTPQLNWLLRYSENWEIFLLAKRENLGFPFS